MEIAWPRILPVIISILVIIGVAIAREQSKTLAAILSTMPINVALATWIIYSGAENDLTARVQFTEGMLIGIFPTVLFLVVVWLTMRSGWGLLAVLAAGYATWGTALFLLMRLRELIRF